MRNDFDDLETEIKPFVEKDNAEYRLHVAIVDHLTGRKTGTKAFNAFCTHIYQGRNKKDGFFLKMLGVVPGVADIMVLWRTKCGCGVFRIGIAFLEVKKPGGIQSSPQKKFAGICHWLGVPYSIVRSIKEAHEYLVILGCPANHHTVREPDLRSDSQKRDDAIDVYKR